VNATAPILTTFFAPNTFIPSSATQIGLSNLSANATDRNFGFFANVPGSIGDQVFQDLNRNNVFDATDLAVPHVVVRLYRDGNNNKMPDAGEFVRSVTTDSRGKYLFADLAEGHYVVEVDLADPNLPGGLAMAPPHLAATILPSEDLMTVDFPLKRVLSLSVSPTGSAVPGSRLTYSIGANYPEVTQLNNVVVSNTLPLGTS
jgi:hypothetical protein